jgi:hypothetical protein
MRASLIVLNRELGDRRLLWWLGMTGLMPLVLPLLGDPVLADAETQLQYAVMLASVVTGTVAILLGATVIATDLVERRLAYYFSRPISGWSLWSGKAGAAALQTLGVGALILLPSLLIHGFPHAGILGSAQVPLMALGALFLAAASHALAVMIRTKGPWLALDAATLGGSSLIVATAFYRFHGEVGWIVPWPFPVPLGLFAGFLAAGALQVVRGRTDTRRGHGILSITLALVLLPCALGYSAYVRWLLHPKVADLRWITSATESPDGRWLALSGRTAGRHGWKPGFLIERRSGRTIPTAASSDFVDDGPKPHGTFDPGDTIFSADGRVAAWTRRRLEGERIVFQVVSLRLDGQAKPVESPVTFSHLPLDWLLSPSGRRLAVIHYDHLAVLELATGRPAMIPVPRKPDGGLKVRFTGDDRLEVYRQDATFWTPNRRDGNPVEAMVIDLATGSHEAVGETASFYDQPWEVSPDGRHILTEGFRAPGGDGYPPRLLALTSGTPVGDLTVAGAFVHVRFLPDSRIVRIARFEDHIEVQILAPDGSLAAGAPTFRFAGTSLLTPYAQTDPRRLLMGAFGKNYGLDLETGAVRELRPGRGPGAPREVSGSAFHSPTAVLVTPDGPNASDTNERQLYLMVSAPGIHPPAAVISTPEGPIALDANGEERKL